MVYIIFVNIQNTRSCFSSFLTLTAQIVIQNKIYITHLNIPMSHTYILNDKLQQILYNKHRNVKHHACCVVPTCHLCWLKNDCQSIKTISKTKINRQKIVNNGTNTVFKLFPSGFRLSWGHRIYKSIRGNDIYPFCFEIALENKSHNFF